MENNNVTTSPPLGEIHPGDDAGMVIAEKVMCCVHGHDYAAFPDKFREEREIVAQIANEVINSSRDSAHAGNPDSTSENQPLGTGRPYSLLDLITDIGVENIRVQALAESIISANDLKDGNTKVCFATREVRTNDLLWEGKGRVGMVIWIDRERLKLAQDKRRSLESSSLPKQMTAEKSL